MQLVKEVVPKNNCYPRRYLLIKDVTDNDARILELCNMMRTDEFDIEDGGKICEAWMVM